MGIINTSPPSISSIIAARGELTQTEAAALVGASRDGWAKWESGARQMPAGAWTLFLLLSDQHPTHRVSKRAKKPPPPPPP